MKATARALLFTTVLCVVGCAQRNRHPTAPTVSAPQQHAPSSRTTPSVADAGPSGSPAVAPPSPPAPSITTSPSASPFPSRRQLFPHVWLDAAARTVEVDCTVPIDVHNPNTPTTYLELIACTRDTKDHESLVVTDAKPSHVHAALLLVGGVAGTPGVWDWSGPALVAYPPTGTIIDVSLRCTRGGESVEEPASMWVVRITDEAPLPAVDAEGHWVFAGSREVVRQGKTWYEADGSGTLIGLTTFGGETLGWTTMYNHDSGVAENVWIANRQLVPPLGSPVTVVLRPRF